MASEPLGTRPSSPSTVAFQVNVVVELGIEAVRDQKTLPRHDRVPSDCRMAQRHDRANCGSSRGAVSSH